MEEGWTERMDQRREYFTKYKQKTKKNKKTSNTWKNTNGPLDLLPYVFISNIKLFFILTNHYDIPINVFGRKKEEKRDR